MTIPGDPSGHPARTALVAARTAVGEVLDVSLWSAADDELLHALTDAVALQRQADAAVLAVLREVDARDARSRCAVPDTQALLRRKHGYGRKTARTLVDLAQALEAHHPATLAALRASELNIEHAAVIVQAIKDLPDTATPAEKAAAEQSLIDAARTLDPQDLAVCGRTIKEHLTTAPDVDDPDEAAAAEAEANRLARYAFERRGIRSRRHENGMHTVTLLIDSETHNALFTALDPLATRHAEVDGIRDERTLTQRRVDAISELLGLALRSDELPMTGGGVKAQVVVTIDWETLLGERYRSALLDDGSTLPPSSLRRLLCEADILPAVLGGDSEVLDLGRRLRRHNGIQRRALGLRDQGCVFPGCTRTPGRCHAHHMTPWSEGGDTSVKNGALLCDHHHRRVHAEGWQVQLAANGYPELRPPGWLDSSHRTRQHHRFTPVRRH